MGTGIVLLLHTGWGCRRQLDDAPIIGNGAIDFTFGRQASASGMIAGGIIWIERNVFGQADKGPIVLALGGVADAAKIVKTGGIWIALDSLRVVGNGAVVFALVCQDNATSLIGVRIGIELDCFGQASESAFVIALSRQGYAPILVADGIVDVDCDGLCIVVNRAILIALDSICNAPQR